MTEEHISQSLIDSALEDSSTDYLAIAIKLDDKGEGTHVGIIINYDNECKIFHFNGTKVKLEAVESGKWYYHNKLTIIKGDEVEAFLAKCNRIRKKDTPEYGWFCNGAIYDDNGDITAQANGEFYTTCVFFCISVIAGWFKNNVYIEFKDWDADAASMTWFKNIFLNDFRNGNLTKEKIEKFAEMVRRILPTEYLATSFIDKLPITHENIKSFLPTLEKVLLQLRIPPEPAITLPGSADELGEIKENTENISISGNTDISESK